MRPAFAVVVPTIGRHSLDRLLESLAAQEELPEEIVLVDDRRDPRDDLMRRVPPRLRSRTRVRHSAGGGPAAARNRGWIDTTSEWVVFLDDDVVPSPDWSAGLRADLGTDAAATQGRIAVPLPTGRPPTDNERNVARLESAAWITADLAVRRTILEELGGFDERFPRAYREDTDFALRAHAAGRAFGLGHRRTTHPVRPDPWAASVRRQRGNADDALIAALHGRAALERGRRRRHVAVVAALLLAVAALVARRPRVALIGFGGWLAGTLELWVARVRGGPRTGQELAGLAATSIVIPPLAVTHWTAARLRVRRLGPDDRWGPEMLAARCVGAGARLRDA